MPTGADLSCGKGCHVTGVADEHLAGGLVLPGSAWKGVAAPSEPLEIAFQQSILPFAVPA